MKNYNVDIHAHSTLKPFSNLYPGNTRSVWESFNGDCHVQSRQFWDIFSDDVARCTQTALSQAVDGNVKIIGVSLFTYESGWTGKKITLQEKSLLSCLTGISQKKIAFINKDMLDDDIYDDTVAEYHYLEHHVNNVTYTDAQQRVWRAKFLTREILQEIHNGTRDLDNENTIYVFVNIEGIQSLGIESMKKGAPEFFLKNYKNIIKERINHIRNNWSSIPQYITFCHHFGNGLAGHARSVPPKVNFWGNVNQEVYLNKGLSDDAKDIIRDMMGAQVRSIMVDIKHFSARARKEYYEYLDVLRAEFPAQKFPVLCSHTGIMNNMETLNELINSVDNKHDINDHYLLNWTINMCKEDLQQVQASGGLVGMQLDLKRLTGKKYLKLIKNASTEGQEKLSCEVVWANLFTAVGLLNNKEAWDILCIGSDYDGIVSYLPQYDTMSWYPYLKEDMKALLDAKDFVAMGNIKVNGNNLEENEITRLMFGLSSEEILDKVFSTNAVAFWKDHFQN